METKAEPCMDLKAICDDFGKKTREFDALRSKAGKPEIGLEALQNSPKAYEKKMQGLDSQVLSDAKAITQFVTLVNDHSSNCHCVTASNGEFQMRINTMKEMILEVVSSAEQLLVHVSSLTG